MKRRILISFLLISSVLTFAGANILKMSVRSQSGKVYVSWQVLTETNLKHYEIERKAVAGSFGFVGTVEPKQDKNYEFVDDSAYKTTEAIYSYRIKIVDNDGTVSYSAEMPVRHNVSSVKRTWGSIKALFR